MDEVFFVATDRGQKWMYSTGVVIVVGLFGEMAPKRVSVLGCVFFSLIFRWSGFYHGNVPRHEMLPQKFGTFLEPIEKSSLNLEKEKI